MWRTRILTRRGKESELVLGFGIGVLSTAVLGGLFLPVKRPAEKVAVDKTVENTDAPLDEVLKYLEYVEYSDEET